MKIKNMKNMSVVLLILCFLSISCFLTEGKEAADNAVAKFHEQLNNEKYDEIFNQSDKKFQESDSKETIVGFLSNVRKTNGRVKSTKRTSWNVKKNTGGTFATVTFETEFENVNSTETFVFSIADEDAKLLNYNIKPNN